MAAKPDDMILFSDLQALIWYASDLAKSSPESLLGPVDVATIPEGGEWRYAVVGDLPPPAAALGHRARSVKGAVSDASVSIIGKGKKKERLETSGVRRYGAFLQAVPLVPAPAQGQAVALLPAEDIEELLDSASLSGKRASAMAEADEGRAFVQLEGAPWYLIERGALPDAKFLRRVPRKRIYLEFGFRHPFEALLAEPADASSALVVTRSGHEVVRHGQWEGIGPGGGRWREVEVSPEEGERSRETGRIEDDLRLVASRSHADPVVWMAEGGGAEEAVVRALSRLREDDLAHVSVADLDAPEGRIFVVRELGSDRRGSRAIPRGRGGKGTFVHVPGSRGVYVPAGMRLAPELPAHIYERTFDMKTGEIALVEADGGDLVVSKVPESAFRPALACLSFEAPAPIRSGTGGRASPWISEPWEEDAPSAPPPSKPLPFPKTPPEDKHPSGREDDGPVDIRGMPLEEAISRLASVFAILKDDVPQDERAALDKAFKSLPASQQATIQAAVKAALAEKGKPRRNASARDEARVRRLIVRALLEAGTLKPHEAKPKGKKGKKDREQATRSAADSDRLAELERKLLDSPEDADAWLHLAQEYLAGGEREEAVRAAEMAAWEGDAQVARRAWEIMADADSTGGYAMVAKFADEAPSLTPMRFAEAANAAADAALEASARRKRARWLLNSAIAAVADDELHAGRERDAILSELAARGLATSELPGLVRRRLLERYSAAEATGEAAEAASSLLEDMTDIGDGIPSPIGAAEVLGEAALHLASMGEAQKAVEVARRAIGRLSQEDQRHRTRGRRPRHDAPDASEGGLKPPTGDDVGWAISALAKAGSALLIAQEHAEGSEALSTAITWVEEHWNIFSTWDGLQHALGAMAKAGIRVGDEPIDQLVDMLRRAFEDTSDRAARLKPIGRLIEDLGEEANIEIETVMSIGISDDLAEIAKRMIHEPGLTQFEYEGTSSAITKLGGRLGPEEAEVLLEIAATGYSETGFNSFTGEYLLVPALAATGDPLERAAELATSEDVAKNRYHVLTIGAAGVKAALDSGARTDKAREVLEALVPSMIEELKVAPEAAVGYYGATGDGASGSKTEFVNLIRQCVGMVPAAFSDDPRRGAKVIRRIFDEALDILEGNERDSASVIAACVDAMASLGLTQEAAQMTEPLLDMLEEARSGVSLSDLAEYAAASAQSVDDKKLMTRLAESIRKTSESMLDPKRSRDVSGAIKAMTEAMKAMAKAGDEAGAEAMASAAAKALPEIKSELDTYGAFEAATELAEAASVLSGASRYEIGRDIASALKTFTGKSLGALAEVEGAKTVVKSARKFLIEGSAYKDALAKWKGEDERRIRDRIIADCRLE